MEKKYQIIYADPPWRYGGRSPVGTLKREPIESLYGTMSDNALIRIDVPSIAARDCLLFLWVVSPHLKECISVAEGWEFKYITVAFVWHKKVALLGNYTMAGTEMCLLFKKGKIPDGKIRGHGNGVKQFWEERPVRASQKPDEIRDRIKRLFPKSNRIELFARQKNEGWDVWGNEVESDIKL